MILKFEVANFFFFFYLKMSILPLFLPALVNNTITSPYRVRLQLTVAPQTAETCWSLQYSSNNSHWRPNSECHVIGQYWYWADQSVHPYKEVSCVNILLKLFKFNVSFIGMAVRSFFSCLGKGWDTVLLWKTRYSFWRKEETVNGSF